MKITLLFLAVVVAVAYAQLQNLVAHEVHVIIAADDAITVAECTEKCDELFGPMAEAPNDSQCDFQCNCQIHKTCKRPPLRTTTPAA